MHDTTNLYRILNKPAVAGCIKNGIPIEIKDGMIRIPEGFYKSSHAELAIDDLGRLIALTRYNRIDVIEYFKDLVKLNHSWWLYSRSRGYWRWEVPDDKWIKWFEIYKLPYNK